MSDGAQPDDAIERLLKESLPDSIVTHFVAVLEVTEGMTQELRLVMSDGMTPWLANGMLLGATRMVDDCAENGDELDFLDDDED
jgi:hypothetical protein